jgi:hypothetical protein
MRNTRLWLVSVILLFSALTCSAQNSGTNVPSQKFQITDCSSSVLANVAGATYTVMNDLAFTANDCIDVTASGVTINLNGYMLTGVPCSCSGISISKGAIGVHVLGKGFISGRGPQYGIHDMGSFALIENLGIGSEGNAGIFLDKVQGSIVKRVTVGGALGGSVPYWTSGGIQLSDTNHCIVENSISSGNGQPFTCAAGTPCTGSNTSGIFVGNSGSQNLSMNNIIVGNQVGYNVPLGISVGGSGNVITGNTANRNNNGTVSSPYGVGICVVASGSPGPVGNNVVIDNATSDNQTDDLDDSNAQCGTDHWVLNTFKTSNLTCIH